MGNVKDIFSKLQYRYRLTASRMQTDRHFAAMARKVATAALPGEGSRW